MSSIKKQNIEKTFKDTISIDVILNRELFKYKVFHNINNISIGCMCTYARMCVCVCVVSLQILLSKWSYDINIIICVID